MAAVQAPTLYRLFGDKRGLLDAVAEHELAAFVVSKAAAKPQADAVQELRDAWDAYVAFGLGSPAVFAIINEVGCLGPSSPAARAGLAVLRERVGRVARSGRLRMPEPRAVALIHASGMGTVATLLATPESLAPCGTRALAGHGVMLKSRIDVAADLEAGRLEQVLPGWSTGDAPILALYPTTRHLPLKTSIFLEAMAGHLQP